MRYLLLLRGVNVGGKNRVPMAELRQLLASLGMEDVSTYINSGNAIFESGREFGDVRATVRQALGEAYPFFTNPVLHDRESLRRECALLPDWWDGDMVRRDALFLTDDADVAAVQADIDALPKVGEKVAFGERVVFWGIVDRPSLSRSSFHRFLLGKPYYRQMTMRNGRTFDKLAAMLLEEGES
ncbi:MAG: DUF1697 domain-containing protein [Atopobiaceae bacterium]